MNVKPVKVAVVGCGMISDAYLKTMTTKFKILEVVGVCDLSPEKAKASAEKYNLKVISMEEIIEDTSIELVVNLTAAQAHYQVVKRLLLAGKHVYTEKVLSVELEHAQELVALANEKNLYLGAAPDTFLGAALQTAKYAIDSGLIGEVTSFHGTLSRDINLFAGLSPITSAPGGGIAFDVGIYYVTALLSLLGPVRTVTGVMDTIKPDRKHIITDKFDMPYHLDCETIASGTLVFENGAIGNLLFDSNSIFTFPEKPAFTIYGTMGILLLADPNLFGGEVKVILKGNSEPTVLQQCHPFESEYRGLGVAEMAWSMRQGRKHRANKEMAYHALEVLYGIKISGASQMHYGLKSSFQMQAALPRGFKSGFEMLDISEGCLVK